MIPSRIIPFWRYLEKPLPVLIFLAILPAGIFAQQPLLLTGKVIGKETGEPLSFAGVALSNQHIAAITDSSGHFRLTINNPLPGDTILFSFIGYEKYGCGVSTIQKKENILIKLASKSYALNEVVISGEKPDLVKIMKKTVAAGLPGE
ncbi:MAG: carboxypeptidase-like regulatory domain-containing protein [Bacteroidia bacterium]|nr:carboxypeptidase-like regulatory domain-containing protein [Bacteroidia bacterium]